MQNGEKQQNLFGYWLRALRNHFYTDFRRFVFVLFSLSSVCSSFRFIFCCALGVFYLFVCCCCCRCCSPLRRISMASAFRLVSGHKKSPKHLAVTILFHSLSFDQQQQQRQPQQRCASPMQWQKRRHLRMCRYVSCSRRRCSATVARLLLLFCILSSFSAKYTIFLFMLTLSLCSLDLFSFSVFILLYTDTSSHSDRH